MSRCTGSKKECFHPGRERPGFLARLRIIALHKTEEERQKDMWNLRDVQRQIVLNGHIDTSAKKEK